MSGTKQAILIHLSDLHFGDSHICNPFDQCSSDHGIPKLVDLISEDLHEKKWVNTVWSTYGEEISKLPVLICATGDYTQSAKHGEFDKAYSFFSGLLSKRILGRELKEENLFIVPGNHDVIFSEKDPDRRFQPYCSFYNKFYEKSIGHSRKVAFAHDANELSQLHIIHELGIVMLELNTCLYTEKDTVDESRGQIDFNVISRIRRDFEAIKSDEIDEYIKIVLMHHHPVLLPMFLEAGRNYDAVINGNSLLRLLKDFGFHLILHGHKHFPQIFTYGPFQAWSSTTKPSQLIVAGGSCGSQNLPPGTESCPTYNIISVKWHKGAQQARIEVITRGLNRMGSDGPLDPDQWSWKTCCETDRSLTSYSIIPAPGPGQLRQFPQKSYDFEKNELLNMNVFEDGYLFQT